MYNLAVIFESSPFDMKGQFNAVHNRVKNLLATGRCKVDVYCLHSKDNAFTRKVRGTKKVPHPKSVEIDALVQVFCARSFPYGKTTQEILLFRPFHQETGGNVQGV